VVDADDMGAPAGMDKWGLATPPVNIVKCFCALVITAKRSVDKLFMHYFHNRSFVSGGFPLASTGAPSLDPAGDFVPRPLIYPPWEKTRGRLQMIL